MTVVGLAELDALAPLAAGRERELGIARALIALALVSGAVVAGLLWRSSRGQRALERSEIEDLGQVYGELYPAFVWPALLLLLLEAVFGALVLRRWP